MTTTSTVTDAAVEAAAMRIAAWSFEEDPTYKWDDLDAEDKDSAREGMRAALEAALPHLAPQPVVAEDEHAVCNACGWDGSSTRITCPDCGSADVNYFTPGGVVPQPVVDREAVLKVITDFTREDEAFASYHASNLTDAVLALLTGSAK